MGFNSALAKAIVSGEAISPNVRAHYYEDGFDFILEIKTNLTEIEWRSIEKELKTVGVGTTYADGKLELYKLSVAIA